MINNVTLMGRLTALPELKTTTNGSSVTSFCIAVERRYKSQSGEKVTDFINCVAWKHAAEFICRYFTKGDMIAITGEIQTRKYTDGNSITRTAVEVNVDQVSFCGSKAAQEPVTTEQAVGAGNYLAFAEIEEDVLPF